MNRLLLTHLKALAIFMACFIYSPITQAATWVKLNDNAMSKLLLDKQSIVTQAALKKVWVKVEYKTPQKIRIPSIKYITYPKRFGTLIALIRLRPPHRYFNI